MKHTKDYRVHLPHHNAAITAEDKEFRASVIEKSAAPAYLSINLKAISTHVFIRLAKKLSFEPGKQLLELGGGYGYLSSYIKRTWPSTQITYTDPSEEAVKKSQQLERYYGVHLDQKWVCAAERTPFRDRTYDTVLMFSSFHHVQDPGQALTEIARVLRTDGSAYFLYEPSAPRYLHRLYNRHVHREGVVENYYSLRQYRQMFKRAGFTTEITLVRDPSLRWKKSSAMYYALLSLLPELVCHLLPCSISIVARHSNKNS